MIPVYEPYFTKESLRYAHEAIDSGWWSSQGKFLSLAQEKLQELYPSNKILLTANGTVSCHLLAKARKYQQSKVLPLIVPNNCYVAAWNSQLMDGDGQLLEPVDADINTWNMDLIQLDQKIKELNYQCQILVVHNMGGIINVPELKRKYPNLEIYEDAAEAFNGKYEGKLTGTESKVSAFSLFGNKHITCGEGGYLSIQDQDTYEYLKCLHGQGQNLSQKRFIHSELGYNYRMTNVAASLLYGQLLILPEILEKKQKVIDLYRKHVRGDNLLFQQNEKNTTHSQWLVALRFIGSPGYQKAEKFFLSKGIEVRPMFYNIYTHKHFKNNSSVGICSTTVADLLNKEIVVFPSSPNLTEEQIIYISNMITEFNSFLPNE